MPERTCETEGCQEPAVVGMQSRWLCMVHFKVGVSDIGGALRRITSLNDELEASRE